MRDAFSPFHLDCKLEDIDARRFLSTDFPVSIMSPSPERGKPTVGKAMALLRKCLETKQFTNVPFVIQGFRSGIFTIDKEGAPMLQLLIQCLVEMNETTGAGYFQSQYDKLNLDSSSTKENTSSINGTRDLIQTEKSDEQTRNRSKKRKDGPNRLDRSPDDGSCDKNIYRNGNTDGNTERGGIGLRCEKTSIDYSPNIRSAKRMREDWNSKSTGSIDVNEVAQTDYVLKLEEVIRMRRGTMEHILPKNCSPSWKTWKQGSASHCRVRILVNHRHINVKEAVLKNTKSSKEGIVGGGQFISGIGRFEDNYIVQRLGAMDMAKRIASKMALDILNETLAMVELNACILLGKTCDQICQRWRHGLWSHARFERALDSIKGVVSRADDGLLYGAKVYAYGSATSGVALGDSDFDVCFVLPGSKDVDKAFFGKDFAVRCLKVLERQTIKDGMKHVNLIATANIPVLKYHDVEVDMDIDVTFGNDESVLVARLIRQHVTEDIRIWNLCVIIKQWAKNRLVCGAFEGFINSLGWVIMVIFFLQHIEKPQIAARFIIEKVHDYEEGEGELQEQYNLIKLPSWGKSRQSRARTSTILTNFFKFFAYEFDFCNEAISLRLDRRVSTSVIVGHHANWALYIEHPLKVKENIVGYVESHGMRTTMDELKRAANICQTQGDLRLILSRKRH